MLLRTWLRPGTSRRPPLMALLLAAGAWLGASPARADSSPEGCSDQNSTPCDAGSRCPETGVECLDDGSESDEGGPSKELAECRSGAKAKGLELRCSSRYEIYCDPNEDDPEEGCAMSSPRRASGMSVALATFAAAAALTYVRAAGRRKRP